MINEKYKSIHERLNKVANDLETISWDMDKNKDYEIMEITKLTESIVWSLMNCQSNMSKDKDDHYSTVFRNSITHKAKLLHDECKKFKVNDKYLHVRND